MAQHTQGNIARRGEFVDRDLTLFSRIRIWGQLIRLPNLFIVLLTQYFIYYILILPAYRASSLAPQLDGPHFALLVLTTILIAAGGYIINDIKDRHIDQKNRPDRLIIGPFISLQTARMAYWLVGLGGLGIALYLAIYIDNLPLVLLYPSAVFLLWWYSHQLKRMPLWGNLIVSLFCAFVAGIVWFAERHGMAALLEQQPSLGMRTQAMLLTYLIFAFVSTLYRLLMDMPYAMGKVRQS
ncbi:MAG: UbiA family prenyltransferase [Bacteroidota bacterium]